MKLHYKKIGTGEPIIILHGLLGALDNWLSIGRSLSAGITLRVTPSYPRSKMSCYLIDARNHGHSPHSDVFNFQVMLYDLYEFIIDHALEKVILMGHSMGGKTAMLFAQQHPEIVDKLIIVDVAPKQYPVQHWRILDNILSVDLNNIGSRKEVEMQLAQFISKQDMRQFLLKNLYWKEKGKLAWRFNLKVISCEIKSIVDKIHEKPTYAQPTLFIRGALSDYLLEEDFVQIKNIFPKAKMTTIHDAGHWVHADQHEKFLKAVFKFLV